MLEKNTKKISGVALLLLGNILVSAQNLGLSDAGNKMMNEVEKAFPFIAGILFIFAAWKALGEYNENGKDVWSGIKVILFYIIIMLVVVGAYKFIKTMSL